MLAGNQPGQIFAFLRRAAVTADLIDAEVGMRAIGQADRGRCARNLLDRDAMFEVAEPRPAILLLDRDAVQPEFAKFRPQIARELIGLVDVRGARRDLVACKIVDRVANCVRGLAEIEVEHAMRVGNHGWNLRIFSYQDYVPQIHPSGALTVIRYLRDRRPGPHESWRSCPGAHNQM